RLQNDSGSGKQFVGELLDGHFKATNQVLLGLGVSICKLSEEIDIKILTNCGSNLMQLTRKKKCRLFLILLCTLRGSLNMSSQSTITALSFTSSRSASPTIAF